MQTKFVQPAALAQAIRFVALCASTARGQFHKLHDFERVSDGQLPAGAIAASGQTIFGTTQRGGAQGGFFGNGTIWSFDTQTGTFAKRHDFDSPGDGSSSNGGVISYGDFLYGSSSSGGVNNRGTVWSFDTRSDGFSKLFDLSTASGSEPVGGLHAADPVLYGTGFAGGANNAGSIWSLNSATGHFEKLYDFHPSTDGEGLRSNVLLRGNLLIGSIGYGGANGGPSSFQQGSPGRRAARRA